MLEDESTHASADPTVQTLPCVSGLAAPFRFAEAVSPPQVRVRIFPPIWTRADTLWPRRIYSFGVRVASGFAMRWRLAPPHGLLSASCSSRRVLPPPSFRPSLTRGALDSASGSCDKVREGLSPPRFTPCWAHSHVRSELPNTVAEPAESQHADASGRVIPTMRLSTRTNM